MKKVTKVESIPEITELRLLAAENDLKKLYDWLMNEQRPTAQTHFTESVARNIAREIEYRLSGEGKHCGQEGKWLDGLIEWCEKQKSENMDSDIGPDDDLFDVKAAENMILSLVISKLKEAKPLSGEGEGEKVVMAKCDECGRDIYDDEVALNRGGIYCFDCCKKMWGMA